MSRRALVWLLALAGCAGGETTPAGSFTGTSGVAPDTEGTSGSQISATAVDSDADGSSSGEPDPGARSGIGAAGIVAAGGRASSANYTLVFTMGQSTPHSSTHASSSYTLHGGIAGANGSPPR